MNHDDPRSRATPKDRVVELDALKALAHPLRARIFDTLSTFGPFTASGLAERLGESSGATSYHLRQLEKHDFVREVAGKGTGRERWWERVPGGVKIAPPSRTASSSERAASRLVLREFISGRDHQLREFLDRGEQELSSQWLDATLISTANLTLTREQSLELSKRLAAVVDEFAETYRGQSTPGTRAVQAQINVFPVMDGEEIPDGRSTS